MFAVEQQPVETGTRTNLGGVRRRERLPQAQHRAAALCVVRGDPLREVAHAKRTEMVPSGPKSTWKLSPARAGTGAVKLPPRMISPGSSVSP